MPTKTNRGGHLKTHNRSTSASTNLGKHALAGPGGATGYPQFNANTDITRTRSGERIRRTGSDLQPGYRVKSVFPYIAYQQHPVHQTEPDRGAAGYQSKKRGITVLEVQTTSDGDDDEWVSSESGAVTPADNDEEEGPPTPKDTVAVLPNSQQPPNPTNNATDIHSTTLMLDTGRNPNNTTNNKLPHTPSPTADSDMTSHIRLTQPISSQLHFQSQAQLHPMTRTQATSTTAAKQRSAPALASSGIGTRKATPVPQSDRPGPNLEKTERVQSHSAGVSIQSVEAPTSTEEAALSTNNNQFSHPQSQILSEPEQSATPRVGPSPLRPTPSETSRSKTHSRPQVRQRPQSMADIRLIDTNVKPENEEADDTFVESPATELPPSRTRPPSTRSMRSIYHHPLIRTRSYTPSTPSLTATAPPAFSPTTASPTLTPNAGSGMILGNTPSNATAENTHYFWPYKLKRQNSQSSVKSVATLPLTSTSSSAALAPTTSTNVTATRERPRTLSHTSAALSSLAAAAAHQLSHHYGFGVPGFAQHAPSRPASPPLPVMFPPPPKSVHSMLPAALTESHLSATAFQRIMADSFMRIGKARTEKAV